MRASWNDFARWAPPRCHHLQWVYSHLTMLGSVDGPNPALAHRRRCTLRSVQLANSAHFGSVSGANDTMTSCMAPWWHSESPMILP